MFNSSLFAVCDDNHPCAFLHINFVAVVALAAHTTTPAKRSCIFLKIHGRHSTSISCGCVRTNLLISQVSLLSSTFSTVLEQVNADIVLTSSRADDDFIDSLNEFSTLYPIMHFLVVLISLQWRTQMVSFKFVHSRNSHPRMDAKDFFPWTAWRMQWTVQATLTTSLTPPCRITHTTSCARGAALGETPPSNDGVRRYGCPTLHL